MGNRFTPTRVEWTNVPVQVLIGWAYGVRENRIVDAPEWMKTDRFDVTGTIPEAAVSAKTPPQPMMQSLLENRFGLKVHADKRALPVYVLSRANLDGHLGPGLQPTDPSLDCKREPGKPLRCGTRVTPNEIEGTGADWTILNLPGLLGLDRPALDRTALQGRFDIVLRWASEQDSQPGGNGVSVFTAVREQLGLRLDATVAPIDVLVVDALTKPTPD
jgi:uncharacterized protein (TIGR03435 family)